MVVATVVDMEIKLAYGHLRVEDILITSGVVGAV